MTSEVLCVGNLRANNYNTTVWGLSQVQFDKLFAKNCGELLRAIALRGTREPVETLFGQ